MTTGVKMFEGDNPYIRFKGMDFILVGDLKKGGAIATPQAYAEFDDSYAHLFEDGRIMRHQRQIGTREDIQLLAENGEPVIEVEAKR